MKSTDTFFEAWGGISSLQHSGPITYSLLSKRLGLPLPSITNLTSFNPAKRFNLANKGSISVGLDADLSIIDFENEHPIEKSDLYF
jgi:allantoinase